MSNINMVKIGEVQYSLIHEKVYSNWGNVISNIRIYPEYIEGLIGLDDIYVMIIFYMNDFQEENDKSWIRRPRGLSDFDERDVLHKGQSIVRIQLELLLLKY